MNQNKAINLMEIEYLLGGHINMTTAIASRERMTNKRMMNKRMTNKSMTNKSMTNKRMTDERI